MKQLTKSQKRLFFILALIIAYGVFDVVSNWDSYSGFYSGKHKKKTKNQVIDKKSLNPTPRVEASEYEKGWKSDPFYVRVKMRTVKKRSAPRQVYLKLDAISFANENSVAMINNKILKAGDSVSGYRLTKIEPKRVVLQKGGSIRVLRLK